MMKIITILLLTTALAACNTTRGPVSAGFKLPPVDQVIPDVEPKPVIPAGSSVNKHAVEYAAAFGRANQRIVDGRGNYSTLATTLENRR